MGREDFNSLAGFDRKVEAFQPEHLGKLEFYLESLPSVTIGTGRLCRFIQ